METPNQDVIYQDWIYKRSRHLHKWRKRWMVLTSTYLTTYKSDNMKKVTEKITLQECFTIKTVDEDIRVANSFRLDSTQSKFYFKAENHVNKERWIGIIGRYMVKKKVLRTHSEEEALNDI